MSSSLISILNSSLNNYNDTNSSWRNFISDYKSYLIANSTVRQITNGYLQGVRFNLTAYLRSINYNTNCAWIIALINNLPNDVYFTTGINFLYVPQFSIIEQLYTSWITTQQNS